MLASLWRYSKSLLRHSTISGVPQIIAVKSPKRKCIKFVVFLICLFGYLYQTSKFMMVYWTYPTVVYISSGLESSPYLPAITVCSHNGINGVKFCNLFPNKCALLRDYTRFCNNSSVNCSDGHKHPLKLMPAIDAHGLPPVPRSIYRDMGLTANDIFGECTIHIEDRELACSNNYVWFPLFDFRGIPSNCYAINSLWRNSTGKKEILSRETRLILTLKGLKEDLFNQETSRAFQISIHDPHQFSNPFFNGFTAERCFKFIVSIDKVHKIFQPAPYNTNCTNYTKLWIERGGAGPLSKHTCTAECILNASLSHDQCVNPCKIIHPSDAPICEGTLDYEAAYRKCVGDICHSACNYESLRLNINKAKPAVHAAFSDVDICTTDLILLFDKMEETRYEYMPKYESVELFSYIGGYLGVWLGISLVAAFDFLECIVLSIRYCICKYKNSRQGPRIFYSKSKGMAKKNCVKSIAVQRYPRKAME